MRQLSTGPATTRPESARASDDALDGDAFGDREGLLDRGAFGDAGATGS